ncbi:hypothetical protein D3C85_1227380 [compost metagenome]
MGRWRHQSEAPSAEVSGRSLFDQCGSIVLLPHFRYGQCAIGGRDTAGIARANDGVNREGAISGRADRANDLADVRSTLGGYSRQATGGEGCSILGDQSGAQEEGAIARYVICWKRGHLPASAISHFAHLNAEHGVALLGARTVVQSSDVAQSDHSDCQSV